MTSRGRVTIPKKVRDSFGFLPGTEVDVYDEGAIIISKGEDGGSQAPADELPAAERGA